MTLNLESMHIAIETTMMIQMILFQMITDIPIIFLTMQNKASLTLIDIRFGRSITQNLKIGELSDLNIKWFEICKIKRFVAISSCIEFEEIQNVYVLHTVNES